MKQISTIAIKLCMVIFAAVSIITACTMNCGSCESEKAENTGPSMCCTNPVSSNSLFHQPNTMFNKSGETTHDACNSCNCNTLPGKESNAVASGFVSFKLHTSPASVLMHSYFAQHNVSVKIDIASLKTLSAPLIPLRI